MDGGTGADHGLDRRSRARTRPAASWRWYTGTAVLAVAAVVILRIAFYSAGDEVAARVQLHSVLRDATIAVSFAAGLLCLVRWRITGESAIAFTGLALFVLGLVTMPMVELAPLLYEDIGVRDHSPLSRTVSTVLAVPLLLMALAAPQVTARLRPGRLALLLVTLLAVTLGVVIVLVRTGGRFDPTDGSLQVLDALNAVAWSFVAIAALLIARRTGAAAAVWVAVASTILSLSGLLYLVAVDHQEPFLTLAIATKLVALCIALAGAWLELLATLSDQSATMLRLLTELTEVRDQLEGDEALEEERRHELRSTLASVRVAVNTLGRYRDHLDEPTRGSLEQAVISELTRLEHMVSSSTVDVQGGAASLKDVLEPLVAAARESGVAVDLDLRGLSVQTPHEDVATLFQNLLTNARKYAPGSPVSIRARRSGSSVIIWFEDRGPGIPPEEREAVLQRGSRGRSSKGVSGTGLGLYVCARLVADAGGELSVHERPGGGAAFRITLPAQANPSAWAAPPPEQVAVDGDEETAEETTEGGDEEAAEGGDEGGEVVALPPSQRDRPRTRRGRAG